MCPFDSKNERYFSLSSLSEVHFIKKALPFKFIKNLYLYIISPNLKYVNGKNAKIYRYKLSDKKYVDKFYAW